MMVCFVVSLFVFVLVFSLFSLFTLLFYSSGDRDREPKIQDAPLNRLDGWFGVDLFLLQGECASVRINGSRV